MDVCLLHPSEYLSLELSVEYVYKFTDLFFLS